MVDLDTIEDVDATTFVFRLVVGDDEMAEHGAAVEVDSPAVFWRGATAGLSGGGLFISQTAMISNSLVTYNEAVYGGGMHSFNARVTVFNSTVSYNHAKNAMIDGL